MQDADAQFTIWIHIWMKKGRVKGKSGRIEWEILWKLEGCLGVSYLNPCKKVASLVQRRRRSHDAHFPFKNVVLVLEVHSESWQRPFVQLCA